MLQQRVSEAVCYLMDREGYCLLAYVDNFCGIGRSAAAAHNAYDAFLSLSRILVSLRASPLAGSMPVGDDLRHDVTWFAQYVARCNGRLLLVEKLPTFEIQCNDCMEGRGGLSVTEFYSIRFPPYMAEQHHISRIEAMNIILAIKTLLPAEMRATEIIITTDNSAAMYSLNTGRTRDLILAACSREIWLLAALQELKITANHQSQDQEDVVIQMTGNLTQTIPCDIDCILTPEL